VEIKKLAAAFAGVTVVFGFGAMAPASAADPQVFGLQQTVTEPNGGEIGYTVTRFFPSEDAIPYPVTGRLYEVSVRADAINGMPTPMVGAFSARTDSGQSYPAIANVWTPQGLSGMTLLPGGHGSGIVYFDAVGEAPTSVVYNGAGETLTWIEPPVAPPAEEAASDEGASGSGESAAASESGSADTSAAAKAEVNSDVAVQDGG
jgi:hypothetical protein